MPASPLKDREAALHAIAEALAVMVEVLAFAVDFYAQDTHRRRRRRGAASPPAKTR
jgi:hypothetical protein